MNNNPSPFLSTSHLPITDSLELVDERPLLSLPEDPIIQAIDLLIEDKLELKGSG